MLCDLLICNLNLNLQFGPINKEKSKWDDDGFGTDLGELWILFFMENSYLTWFNSIARLDGITNKARQPTTMEHYLQLDDYETEPTLQTGKKRVRKQINLLVFSKFSCVLINV